MSNLAERVYRLFSWKNQQYNNHELSINSNSNSNNNNNNNEQNTTSELINFSVSSSSRRSSSLSCSSANSSSNANAINNNNNNNTRRNVNRQNNNQDIDTNLDISSSYLLTEMRQSSPSSPLLLDTNNNNEAANETTASSCLNIVNDAANLSLADANTSSNVMLTSTSFALCPTNTNNNRRHVSLENAITNNAGNTNSNNTSSNSSRRHNRRHRSSRSTRLSSINNNNNHASSLQLLLQNPTNSTTTSSLSATSNTCSNANNNNNVTSNLYDLFNSYKKKERNLLSACCSIFCITILAVSLVETRWFYLNGGGCNVNYVGVAHFFAPGRLEYQIEISKVTKNEIIVYNFILPNGLVLKNCANREILLIMRTIIAFVFMAIFSSCIGLLLDTFGCMKIGLKLVRRHGIFHILTVVFCLAINGFCFWISERMSEQQFETRLKKGRKIDISFDVSYYLIVLASGMSILATAFTLIRRYPSDEDEQLERLLEEYTGFEDPIHLERSLPANNSIMAPVHPSCHNQDYYFFNTNTNENVNCRLQQPPPPPSTPPPSLHHHHHHHQNSNLINSINLLNEPPPPYDPTPAIA